MKEKLKWIFLYGGLVWGTFCAAIMMIIRGIQEKPMAFGSFPIFLIICILGGIFFGTMTYKYVVNKKFKKQMVTLEKLSQVLLAWIVIYSIYGLITRFLLVPLNYNDTIGANIFGWVVWAIAFNISFKIFKNNKTSTKTHLT